MNIIKAEHLGMCFGVRDAIALAVSERTISPLTILGELVHNESVLGDLRSRGINIKREVSEVQTRKAMITAHGTSDRVLEQAKQQGLQLVDATCPLVHFAHRALAELLQGGFHPIIVGKRDHVEVKGLTDDLEEFDVVLTEADIATLKDRPRFGVVAQTTQPVDRVRTLVESIRRQFPKSEVRFIDTVCRPTKQRQEAAVELAQRCHVVIVIGGAASNNTRELVETCRRCCGRVHHVLNASGLEPEWFEGWETVGITAGTSTPDNVINEVEQALHNLKPRHQEFCTNGQD